MSLVGVTQVQARLPVTVFQLQDRVNMGNTLELESTARAAHAQGARFLLLDLTLAPSFTSAGLRSLLIIHRLFEPKTSAPPNQTAGSAASSNSAPAAKSKTVKLLNPSPEVRRTLQISGFDRYFEIYTDLKKALASF